MSLIPPLRLTWRDQCRLIKYREKQGNVFEADRRIFIPLHYKSFTFGKIPSSCLSAFSIHRSICVRFSSFVRQSIKWPFWWLCPCGACNEPTLRMSCSGAPFKNRSLAQWPRTSIDLEVNLRLSWNMWIPLSNFSLYTFLVCSIVSSLLSQPYEVLFIWQSSCPSWLSPKRVKPYEFFFDYNGFTDEGNNEIFAVKLLLWRALAAKAGLSRCTRGKSPWSRCELTLTIRQERVVNG